MFQVLYPDLPEVVRRFRAQQWPRYGRMRVPYGQTYDKDRKIAECLRHGLQTKYGVTVKELVNPPPPTRFKRHENDVKERVYETSWAKPLGKHRRPSLPANYDPTKVTFGVWLERGIDIAGCMGQIRVSTFLWNFRHLLPRPRYIGGRGIVFDRFLCIFLCFFVS